MGHPAGDQVLQEVAKRLSGSVKRSDLVCRMGGDEFTIALTPQPDTATAADVPFYVGQRILKRDSRSEEHTSELQSRPHLVCSLLLEKKKKKNTTKDHCLLRILSILNPFNTNTNAN